YFCCTLFYLFNFFFVIYSSIVYFFCFPTRLSSYILLLALVSRGNVWQANVPMFEVPNLSLGIVHNNSLSATISDIPHYSRISAQDRKSTRLNSSHVKMSYAVFCLKKKSKSIRFYLL